MINPHHLEHYVRVGEKLGVIEPVASVAISAAKYNSASSESAAATSDQIHDDLAFVFNVPENPVLVYRDSKSASGNSYVFAPPGKGVLPANGDYLTLSAAQQFVRLLECEIPSFGCSLITALNTPFSVVVKKTVVVRTPEQCLQAGGAPFVLAGLASTLEVVKGHISGGLTRFDSTVCKAIKTELTKWVGKVTINAELKWEAYPRAALLLVDALNLLDSLIRLTPRSLTSYLSTCKQVNIPEQNPTNNANFKALARTLAQTALCIKEIPALMAVSKVLKYDRGSNRFMEELVSGYSANILDARWEAYAKLCIAIDKTMRMIDTKWNVVKKYIDLCILQSCRKNIPLPAEVNKILGFWHETHGVSGGSAPVWNLCVNDLSESDLAEELQEVKQLIEGDDGLLKLLSDVMDFSYYKCDKPAQGFRLYRDFYQTTGREYIYRVEKKPSPEPVGKRVFRGVEFCNRQVLRVDGSVSAGGSFSLSRIAAEPKTVTLVPSGEVRGGGRFPLASTQVDPSTGVFLGGDYSTWYAKLVDETIAHCSYGLFSYDEVTKNCAVTVMCEAFSILPPSTGSDIIAFGCTSRFQAVGSRFTLKPIDFTNTSVPALLLAFKADEVLNCSEEKLRELYEARMKSIPSDSAPSDLLAYPALIEKREIDPFSAALGWQAQSEMIVDPIAVPSAKGKTTGTKRASRIYYVGPGTDESSFNTGLPRVVSLPNDTVYRLYWIPREYLSEKIKGDLRDPALSGVAKAGSLRIIPNAPAKAYPALTFYTPDAAEASYKSQVTPETKSWATEHDMVLLRVAAHYRDNFSYTSGVERSARNGSPYSTDLSYGTGLESYVKQRESLICIEDFAGTSGLKGKYFRRFADSVSERRLDDTPIRVASLYARNLSLACYAKLSGQCDCDYVDIDIACEELTAYKEEISSSSYKDSVNIAAALAIQGAECTIGDMIKAIDDFISKKDFAAAKTLVSRWGGVYVERATVMGMNVPIVVDSLSEGVMAGYLAGTFTFFEFPRIVSGIAGSTKTALDEHVVQTDIRSFIEGCFVRSIEQSLCSVL